MSPGAKKLGVTRGMPVFRIKKLFPQMSGRFAELGIETLSYITAFDDSTIRVR